ncbi:hypothetical protein I3842_11G062800 [Carya illinoinensis]|uniref:Uncharacterized protein n=1 Tax=Carya illinoinensis TaxID=32201 RepID=A0A922DN34_CARIL|nr:hypothetical protein I3842_11G062800 [Carya illinoinensis]
MNIVRKPFSIWLHTCACNMLFLTIGDTYVTYFPISFEGYHIYWKSPLNRVKVCITGSKETFEGNVLLKTQRVQLRQTSELEEVCFKTTDAFDQGSRL